MKGSRLIVFGSLAFPVNERAKAPSGLEAMSRAVQRGSSNAAAVSATKAMAAAT